MAGGLPGDRTKIFLIGCGIIALLGFFYVASYSPPTGYSFGEDYLIKDRQEHKSTALMMSVLCIIALALYLFKNEFNNFIANTGLFDEVFRKGERERRNRLDGEYHEDRMLRANWEREWRAVEMERERHYWAISGAKFDYIKNQLATENMHLQNERLRAETHAMIYSLPYMQFNILHKIMESVNFNDITPIQAFTLIKMVNPLADAHFGVVESTDHKGELELERMAIENKKLMAQANKEEANIMANIERMREENRKHRYQADQEEIKTNTYRHELERKNNR